LEEVVVRVVPKPLLTVLGAVEEDLVALVSLHQPLLEEMVVSLIWKVQHMETR
jgi:hypothetical protein